MAKKPVKKSAAKRAAPKKTKPMYEAGEPVATTAEPPLSADAEAEERQLRKHNFGF